MDTKPADLAEAVTEMVGTHAALKYPAMAGRYAWEAGCLSSIIKTLAANHPEVVPTLERELEWHKKQVLCLSSLTKPPENG
jgi:hypothetical protein